MNRNRNRRLTPAAEALEGRLALSAGVGMALPFGHAPTAHVNQVPTSLKASFKGKVQVNGSTIITKNLSGTIGPDRFTGSGTGTESGTHFLGGTVNLKNNKGTVTFALAPGVFTGSGKSQKQTVNLVAVAGTGKYASFVGLSGTLSSWSVPDKTNAPASIKGTLHA